MKLIKISKEEYSGYVYDLSVAKNRNFIADGIVIHNCAKKRYAMNIIDDGGVRYNKPKIGITGIQAIQSSTPVKVREWLTKAIKLILTIDSKSELYEYIDKCENEFKSLEPEDIGKPQGITTLTKYTDNNTITGYIIKGCPIGPRSAIVYNKYILNTKVDHKGFTFVRNGDKIKILYMKLPNPLKENVIGFPDIFPRELVKYINYDTQFNKVFLKPLEPILKAIKWDKRYNRLNLEELLCA